MKKVARIDSLTPEQTARNPKKATPFPEMTLPARERRQRARRIAKMTAGDNPPTRRQIKRLPRRDSTKAGRRKMHRAVARIMRKQGLPRRYFEA